MTPVTTALLKMRGAGFSVQVVAGRLRVSPADRLTAVQRQWIAANRDALIVELANDDPHIGDTVATFDAVVVRVTPDPTTHKPVSVGLPESTDTGGGYPVWVTPVMAGTVRCADCGYGSRALPGDELGAWRLCEAGLGGRFALARHRCDGFKAG
jgi:hypothetical protein